MRILGIETSCDETSCAVVENGRTVITNVIASQIELHRKTGGVVPEVAAREHVVKIVPVLEEALKMAGAEGRGGGNRPLNLNDIDAIAVTQGPGLLSSVLVGVNAAMTLAKVLGKPLIPVNHIEGHIYANWIMGDAAVHVNTKPPQNLSVSNRRTSKAHESLGKEPQFPAAVLTVSGGHNELILWKGHGRYQFLGATLDDAAGEAFDKVARLLGLPYPGGPPIQKAALNGNPKKYPLPRAWLTHRQAWDFSFSGLKTAVLRLVKAHEDLRSKKTGAFPTQFICDVAASFQEAVCDVLATKLIRAAQKYKVKEIHLAGGVSANTCLRNWTTNLIEKKWPESGQSNGNAIVLETRASKRPLLRFCTDLKLCTDNAAMIAAAGYFKFKKNPAQYKKWKPITANPNLAILPW